MHKLMIAADIHGSVLWAERVVAKFKESGADALGILGDFYNHGPRNPLPEGYAPMNAATALNEIADKIIAVKGNCDSEVDEYVSDFDILSENVLFEFGRKIFLTHGHVHNKDELPHLGKGDVLCYGHFHISEITETENGVIAVNVGSASLPKDEINAYGIIDDKGVTLYGFDGSVIDFYEFD